MGEVQGNVVWGLPVRVFLSLGVSRVRGPVVVVAGEWVRAEGDWVPGWQQNGQGEYLWGVLS